jgi:hypothetical protein
MQIFKNPLFCNVYMICTSNIFFIYMKTRSGSEKKEEKVYISDPQHWLGHQRVEIFQTAAQIWNQNYQSS